MKNFKSEVVMLPKTDKLNKITYLRVLICSAASDKGNLWKSTSFIVDEKTDDDIQEMVKAAKATLKKALC